MLASAWGQASVAEGMETREQLITLRALGCQFGQGHYFSPRFLGPDSGRCCRMAAGYLNRQADRAPPVVTGGTRKGAKCPRPLKAEFHGRSK